MKSNLLPRQRLDRLMGILPRDMRGLRILSGDMRRNKMAEKSRTLKKKELSAGYSVSLFKYWTSHPKTMPKTMQREWHPKFDGSYEMVIALDRVDERYARGIRGFAHENTHPKLSWYMETEHFKKLFEKIDSPEDFYVINKNLNECLTVGINHKDVSKKVEGLLKRL